MDTDARDARIEVLRTIPRCAERWSDPRDWPEGEGEWKGMIDSMDSIEGLLDLIKIAQPKRVLEIGSSRGGSTEVFLLLCEEVVAVDPWGIDPEMCLKLDRVSGSAYRQQEHIISMHETGRRFHEKVGHYPNLKVIQGYSPGVVLDLFPKYAGYFDLVYVDAIHEYQAVIEDVHAAWPLVREGGWIAGHDYAPLVNFKDIIPAVKLMFPQGVQTFSDSSWLVRRPDVAPRYADLPKSENGDAPPDIQLPRPEKAYPPLLPSREEWDRKNRERARAAMPPTAQQRRILLQQQRKRVGFGQLRA